MKTPSLLLTLLHKTTLLAFLAGGIWLLAFKGTPPFAQEAKVEIRKADAPKDRNEGAWRRSASINRLRQIALAMHNYHDVNASFPPAARCGGGDKPLLSWRVLILPFVEQQALYDEFHLDEPWDSAHNRKLIARMPDIYRSSANLAQGKTTFLGIAGESGMFPGARGVRIADVTDGTSNTLFVVDAADSRAVVWTKPEDLTPDFKKPLDGLVGHFADGFLATLVDGSVHFFPKSLKPQDLKALFTRNGGEVMSKNYTEVMDRNTPKAFSRVVRAQPNEALIKQLEAQYGGRLKQVCKSEMHFMRMACQPTRQQFDKIAADGEVELKTTISNYVRRIAGQRMGGGQLNGAFWQNSASEPDSRKLISDTVLKIARPHLSPEQIARYEKEIAERALARQKVVILMLVAGMDRQLELTVEQRQRITEILEKNPDKSWNGLQTVMMVPQNFPTMPDGRIMPLLTENQKSAWRKVQKGNVYFGNVDLDWFQQIDFDDEVWNDAGGKK